MEPVIQTIVEEIRRRGNTPLADALDEGRLRLVLEDEALWLQDPALHAFLAQHPEPPASSRGEPWGTMSKGRWRPSLAAMLRVGARMRWRRAVLEEAAVQPFLYGRPVLRRSLRELDRSVGPGDWVWACEPRGEVLGLAKVLPPGRGDEALEPILDLGWYLREGG